MVVNNNYVKKFTFSSQFLFFRIDMFIQIVLDAGHCLLTICDKSDALSIDTQSVYKLVANHVAVDYAVFNYQKFALVYNLALICRLILQLFISHTFFLLCADVEWLFHPGVILVIYFKLNF